MPELTKEEEVLLERLLRKSKTGTARKLDFDNMTDQERAAVNRTIHPMTPAVPYQEYPKMIYGRRANGQFIQSRVTSKEDEDAVKAGETDTEWGSLLELGLETCPSRDDGRAPVKIQMLGAAVDDAVILDNTANIPHGPPAPYVEHPLAKKRGPGRPPKNAQAS